MISLKRGLICGVFIIYTFFLMLLLFIETNPTKKPSKIFITSTSTSTISTTTTLPSTTTVLVTTTTVYIPPTTNRVSRSDSDIPQTNINWDLIADCESGSRNKNGIPIPGTANWSINTGNGYYGGLQFSHETWIYFGGGNFSNNAHLTSRENQIFVASGMKLSHWPTCGKYG